MTHRRPKLPPTASVANPGGDGRLYAPSVTRNSAAIRAVITKCAPNSGHALEIASGTGEHVTRFGHDFPDIVWQPTEVDDTRMNSVRVWQSIDGTQNVLEPKYLDATAAGWAAEFADQDLVLTVNLLHLISSADAEILIHEVAKALSPGGVFLIYGPFMRGSDFTSDGDREFDDSIRRATPALGYKSYQQVQDWQKREGLSVREPIEMPANNLMLAAYR